MKLTFYVKHLGWNKVTYGFEPKITTSLAIIALLVSCTALYFSWRIGRTQNKVNLLTLENNEKSKLESKKVLLSYELDTTDISRQRLYINNLGPNEARNVRLEFLNGNDLVLDSELTDKFPVPKLSPNKRISLIASVTSDTVSHQEIKISWDDDSSNGQTLVELVSVYG